MPRRSALKGAATGFVEDKGTFRNCTHVGKRKGRKERKREYPRMYIVSIGVQLDNLTVTNTKMYLSGPPWNSS
jgi:hypothetical protein